MYCLLLCLPHILGAEKIYFISPNSNVSCPKSQCFTLSQFAAQPPTGSSGITMVFLEGEHTLSRNFSLHTLESLTLITLTPSVEVSLSCLSGGILFLTGIHDVSMSGITLVNCEKSSIESVNHFTLKSMFVQSLSERYAVFKLKSVNQVLIINSTFFSNEVGAVEGIGCAIFEVCNSSMTILHSHFEDNLVEMGSSCGSVLCAFNSSITIHDSSFSNNKAPTGGVLYADNSAITLLGCNFINNHASTCGVAYIYHKSHFTVDSCTFRNNNSTTDAGVMCVTHGSVVEADHTLFQHNSAYRNVQPGGNGGVLLLSNVSRGSFFNCTFLTNEANEGGVISTSNGTLVSIVESTFIDNRAISPYYGFGNSAIVDAYNNVSIFLKQSIFSDNYATTSGGCAQILNFTYLSISKSCVFKNNTAFYGGAFSIWTSTIVINSEENESPVQCDKNLVKFIGNSAQHGGALNLI